MKYTRWSCRHIFNASSNFTHRGPPVFFLLHNRQTHSIDILHGVRAHALTLHSDISSRGICCRSHGVLPTSSLRPTPSRSSRSPTPRHFCTSPTTQYISLLALAHPSLITFHNDWLPETPGCSDSIGPGCIEHLRRVSVRSRHGGVVCVSTTQFCSWSSPPENASLLATLSRFNWACLSLPAPSGPTCCLKSLLRCSCSCCSCVFLLLHLFAANPAAQLQQLCFAQGFAQLPVR